MSDEDEHPQQVPKHFTSSIPVPSKLDLQGDAEQSWRRFHRQWKNYSIASRLNKEEKSYQCAVFLACVGEEAQEIYEGLPFGPLEDNTDIETVIKKFEEFCIGATHEVYESFKFHSRRQEEGETIDGYVATLRKQAKNCKFGDQEERMIRDRVVIGIKDDHVRQKLLEEKELDLKKAVQICRAYEASQMQVKSMAGATESSVNRLKQTNSTPTKDLHSPSGQAGVASERRQNCTRCGGRSHRRAVCPAQKAKCLRCSKIGHYANCCRTRIVQEVEEQPFLGMIISEVTCDPWKVKVKMNGQETTFKMDTGADVTVIPESKLPEGIRLRQTDRKLYGASRESIAVKGVFSAKLQFQGKSITDDIYVIQSLGEPLLGRPAISSLQLLVRVCEVSTDSCRAEFPELFGKLGKVENSYRVHLKDDAHPFAVATPRRLALPLQNKVKEELQNLQEMGVIRPVTKPTDWCAPIVVVPKSSGRIRLCVDFTKLNEAVKRENFPLPSTDELLAKLAGATVFTKLDCNQGFHQIPLDPASQELTTFITPFGRFCYTRLPFGISSGPEIFQRMMSQLLSDILGVVCDMDDILVYGTTQKEHDQAVRKVLNKLKETGLTLNAEKCEFSKESVKFLGHIISSKGVHIDPEKLKAIVNFPRPTNVSELRRLLGMLNHVSKFAGSNLAEISKALRELLKKDTEWTWNSMHERAFQKIKEQLSSAPVLAHYHPNKKTKLSADSSSFGLGAVLLQQQEDGTTKPVFYISRALTATEQRYAQVEKEALAVTWACEKFAPYILGLKDLTIETDHKPLLALLKTRNLDELSPRIQRFRMKLMRYAYQIEYTKGKNLTTADALSRAPSQLPDLEDKQLEEETNAMVHQVVSSLPCTEPRLNEISQKQQSDELCQKIIRYCQHGWPDKCPEDPALKPYWSARADISLQNDLLLHGSRLIIPEALKQDILGRLHTGHQGVVKTRALARESVWWPGLSVQIEKLVNNCPVCTKERKVPPEPLQPSPVPEYPWQTVGTDLLELDGKHYLLVMDYYSKFIEICVLNSTTSQIVINHMKGFFARHGIPEKVVSDNGPQFSCRQFKDFAEEYEFRHVTSSPHNPQSNGEAERGVQTVKNLLKKTKDPYKAMLMYRATPLQHGKSPAELLMGRKIRTVVPANLSQRKPQSQRFFQEKEMERKRVMKKNFDRRHRARAQRELKPGQAVWVGPQRQDSGVIVRKVSNRSYEVRTQWGTLRRNRRHLTPQGVPMQLLPPRTLNHHDFLRAPLEKAETTNLKEPEQPRATPNEVPVNPKGAVAPPVAPHSAIDPAPSPPPPLRRSSRISRAPDRLDL